MYLFVGYAALIIGMVIGCLLNSEETCPRVIKGYNCRGDETCDHSKVALYSAHLDMAKADESRLADDNLWGGHGN